MTCVGFVVLCGGQKGQLWAGHVAKRLYTNIVSVWLGTLTSEIGFSDCGCRAMPELPTFRVRLCDLSESSLHSWYTLFLPKLGQVWGFEAFSKLALALER